jgi:hypothetical protein
MFHRREDNIKLDLQEIGRRAWSGLIGLGIGKSYGLL